MVMNLQWKTVAHGNEAFHIARTVTYRRGDRPHRHDFAELFWVDGGQGVHQVNGQSTPLTIGDLVFIRPTDTHGFDAEPDPGLAQINVAFPSDLLADLQRRHPAAFGRLWTEGPCVPTRVRLSPDARARLQAEAEQLAIHRTSRLVIERFLINLAWDMETISESRAETPVPAWLQAAIDGIVRPEHVSGGVPRLVRLAGRSHEHVARAIRTHYGCTPTDVVRNARLTQAASQLALTDHKIESIAHECGCRSLPHFYRVFQERYHETPRQYRQRHLASTQPA